MRHIFGPVASRRLGMSLGVDLIPYKTCSFDCIYCELGGTTKKTVERREYVSAKNILNDLRRYLSELPISPDYITVGGSGEPTLNSQIGGIIKEIKRFTSIPVAVLTNGSLLFMDQTKKDLLEADVILPSLDAVTNNLFQYINRPHLSLKIEEIIQGLIDFRKMFKGSIWLEVLFCQGINDSKNELQKIKETIDRINPDKIQLNTVVRPPAEDFSYAVDEEYLKNIRDMMGEKAEIVTNFSEANASVYHPGDESRILNLLKRRPCTLKEISQALGIHQNELVKSIDKLREEEKVQYHIYNRQGFYQAQ